MEGVRIERMELESINVILSQSTREVINEYVFKPTDRAAEQRNVIDGVVKLAFFIIIEGV